MKIILSLLLVSSYAFSCNVPRITFSQNPDGSSCSCPSNVTNNVSLIGLKVNGVAVYDQIELASTSVGVWEKMVASCWTLNDGLYNTCSVKC